MRSTSLIIIAGMVLFATDAFAQANHNTTRSNKITPQAEETTTPPTLSDSTNPLCIGDACDDDDDGYDQIIEADKKKTRIRCEGAVLLDNDDRESGATADLNMEMCDQTDSMTRNKATADGEKPALSRDAKRVLIKDRD